MHMRYDVCPARHDSDGLLSVGDNTVMGYAGPCRLGESRKGEPNETVSEYSQAFPVSVRDFVSVFDFLCRLSVSRCRSVRRRQYEASDHRLGRRP